MENLIKRILKEYIETSLDEVNPTPHFLKRMFVRLRNGNDFIVVSSVMVNDKVSRREIGALKLSEETLNDIDRRIDTILNTDLPENLSFGIIVYNFDVDIDDISYKTREDRFETLRDVLKNDANLYIMDRETKSMGDTLFLIVKDNNIVTAFFERSPNLPSVKEKRNLDYVITLDELSKFAVK